MTVQNKGFTLIELLITTGILAVLTTTTVLIINPAEIFRQARDAQRISDMDVLKRTILFIQYAGNSIGAADTAYTSIANATGVCPALSPSLSGRTYRCVVNTTATYIDGSGWIPLNFGNPLLGNAEQNSYLAVAGFSTTGAPISDLPLDPRNDAPNGIYYVYLASSNGSSFEFVAKFESTQYQAKAQNDGGYDNDRYETGTDLLLWKTAAGL